MTQRFNAPPGWDVPPNFVPAADWQPDPSWPPAPAGWNFWVDDAAPASSGSQPADVAAQSGAPYGAAPGTPYGTPPAAPAGAYGSTAPGSAQAALAEGQRSNAKRSLLIGIGLIVLTVVLVFTVERLFWYLPIVGIVLVIKGLIDMNKAKKAAAAAQGPFGVGGSVPGVTPPGQNPPGTF